MSADAPPLSAVPDNVALSPQAIEDIWVPTPGQNAILTHMKGMLVMPDSTRPTNLAIAAASNYGKSMLLEYFEEKSNPEFDFTAEATPIPVVRVDLTGIDDSLAVLRQCLSVLNVRFTLRMPDDELWRRLVLHIQPLGVKLFLLDEVSSIARLNAKTQKEFLQIFRGFGAKTKRPIVIAGTEEVRPILDHDRQFRTRFLEMTLPAIASDLEMQKLLKGFGLKLNPRGVPGLATATMVNVVTELVGREPGSFFKLLKAAATLAASEGHTRISEALLRRAAPLVPGRQWTGR